MDSRKREVKSGESPIVGYLNVVGYVWAGRLRSYTGSSGDANEEREEAGSLGYVSE